MIELPKAKIPENERKSLVSGGGTSSDALRREFERSELQDADSKSSKSEFVSRWIGGATGLVLALVLIILMSMGKGKDGPSNTSAPFPSPINENSKPSPSLDIPDQDAPTVIIPSDLSDISAPIQTENNKGTEVPTANTTKTEKPATTGGIWFGDKAKSPESDPKSNTPEKNAAETLQDAEAANEVVKDNNLQTDGTEASAAATAGPSQAPSQSPPFPPSGVPSQSPSQSPSYSPSMGPSQSPPDKASGAEPSAASGKGGIWGLEPDKEETTKEAGSDTPFPVNTNTQQQATESPSTPSGVAPTLSVGGGEVEEGTKDEDESQPAEELQSTTEPYQYRRRGRPVPAAKAQLLAKQWGQWTLVDPKANQRPKEDYCGAYPNRDIPWANFPSNAWQVDETYVSKFLSEGKQLVERAMEVHLAEYGFGMDDLPGQDFETRRDKSPFKFEIVNDGDVQHRRRLSTGVNDRAGWAPQKSFNGLVRRLLHAVVAGSDFNLVLGGHSAAAGHGNHFQQSYALQFQRVMEPVFARLGVKHYSRNTGMGGLGTIQSVMGARDIYGSNVDILIWDSSMTEPTGSPDFDLFLRQGILGSDRAPMLWAGVDELKLLPTLQEHADIDYMMYGNGKGAIPSITDPTTINEIPWAARYIKCDNDWQSLCKDNRYNGTCWIERPDHFVPPTSQNAEPGGRASWHEGNREHQLYGRTLSFTVLTALHKALDIWDKRQQHKLSDDMWHMSDYYANIKSKIANLDPEVGICYEVEKKLPTAFCTTQFQARTEFTPRANPEETSVRSIMKPFGPDASIPQPELNIYDPPDVYNPYIGVPEGEVDILAIIENGVDYATFDPPMPILPPTKTNNRLIELTVDDYGQPIVPGLGWGINTKASPHLCNGTYDSFCGRSADHKCLLYGHNDHRGGLTFDSLSGWGIFTLRNVKQGTILLKMDSWRNAKDNPVTEGWTEENDGKDVRQLSSALGAAVDKHHQAREGGVRRRMKKDDNQKFCDDFLLEFAFGDKVVRLTTDEILGERHSLVQRVVQIWTVLNDPDFTMGEAVDLELGIRLQGCERQHVFWLSTIYWA